MILSFSGRLHLFDRRFTPKVISVFSNSPITLISKASKSGLVLCVSAKENLIKIYDVDKLDKNDLPGLIKTVKLNASGIASCIAVDEVQNLIAIGYTSGTLILIRGDLKRDYRQKQRVLLTSGSSISGLTFRASKLYVATTDEVILFNVAVKDKESLVRLDDIGCPAGLFVATEGLEEAHIAIARQDAIYFYSSEGRGQCHAIEGDKSHIFWFRTYLVVVSKDPITYSSAKQLASTPQPPPAENVKQILTIFDIQNKFIAYSAPIKAIKALTSEWGLLYGLNDANDVLFQLVEKDIQSKLELLFKKNFYDIAIKIAKSHHYDNDGLKDIFRQYGNHLYSKGDNSGAIDNYIKTIGCLEPSYVIRKFLDAHKIHYLTAYLQALHTQGQANEDHTTLLLNCYTKLKDKSKLDEFIFKDREKIDFDVAVAIKVCRQANYYEHALALAKDHGFDDMYLEIIFDLKHYPQGLEYIQKLDMSQKLKSMQAYGSLLMKHLPQETTDFLKKVCVEDPDRAVPDDFLHLFVRNNEGLLDFLEQMIDDDRVDCSEVIYNNLLEHYLHHYKTQSQNQGGLKEEQKILDILSSPKLSYDNDQALVLCQLHNFLRGTLYLYEKKGLHEQILKLHLEMNNLKDGLNTCRQFGDQHPNLWVEALTLLGDCSNTLPETVQVIEEILNTIEEKALMSPLLVVRTLAGSPVANLGIVRRYLLNVYQNEEKQIDEHAKIIAQYQVDTEKVRGRIHELKSNALTLQQSKCSACQQSLELPTLHFLCGHSYHKHCFQSYADNDNECPACLVENKKILDIVKSQQQSREQVISTFTFFLIRVKISVWNFYFHEQHDAFHSQLEKAEDGFAGKHYLGLGLYNIFAFFFNCISIYLNSCGRVLWTRNVSTRHRFRIFRACSREDDNN